MVRNELCLQLTSDKHLIVPCRTGEAYPGGLCPLDTCEAREALKDQRLLARVVGIEYAIFLGPENKHIRRLVFHFVCPGFTRDPNWRQGTPKTW
ncbi:hypothetical protein A2Y99_04505 [Candidatus Gottesmanbacteria bacterium RBG_13_37_7]|uniref:Uncharacterized protein n=1 Tax=Candidatus Gottesmanbacteria bacterium RBG_13_37_7 TaxID=1798369 RepID=A0A1F5YGM9_9BACT|nr:MAG: hypothetical protein A2Y99_04505 [Candidatus Gottesmanbacteria bacterium RBG_13_37_7]